MATSRRRQAGPPGPSSKDRSMTGQSFGGVVASLPASFRTRSYTGSSGDGSLHGGRKRSGGSRKKEVDFDILKESIMDGLGRTDVKAIDDGLRGLSSSVQVNVGLLSFSDAEDDDEDDDDDESTDSGGLTERSTAGARNASAMSGKGKAGASAGTSSSSGLSNRASRQRIKTAGGGGSGVSGGNSGSGSSFKSKSHGSVMTPLQQLSLARAASAAVGGGRDDSDSDSDWDAPWAVIKVRSEKEIVKSLDSRFFVEDYDPVTAVLVELPNLGPVGGGDGVLNRQGSSTSSLGGGDPAAGSYDEYLERQLRDMDVARVAVTRQIASMVHENYAALVGGMRQVQAVDLDLARAGVQVSNGRRRLQRALAHVTGPVLKLVKTDCQRRRLLAVRSLTMDVNEAFSSEGKIQEDLAAGRFTEAVARAETLGEVVRRDEQLTRLGLLGGVRDRTGSIVEEVRQRAKLALGPLCQTFSPEVYGGIIRAYLLLEDRGALAAPIEEHDTLSPQLGEHGPDSEGDTVKLSSSWISKGLADLALPLPSSLLAAGAGAVPAATSIGHAQVERTSLAREDADALLANGKSFSDSSEDGTLTEGCLSLRIGDGALHAENSPGKGPSGMEMLAEHILTSFVDEFNRMLSDAIFEALLIDQGVEMHARRRSRRAFEPAPPLFLPAPQLLEGIVQICHGAAEILHSYFCCTQWHASAFDERLEDDAFLHTQTLPPTTASTSVEERIGDAGDENGTVEAVTDENGGVPMEDQKGGGVRSDRRSVEGEGGREVPDIGDNDSRVDILPKLLVRHRRVLWEEIEKKMMSLLSEASVSGGALELEDLAGVVGAVGLLATLGDEFVDGSDSYDFEDRRGGDVPGEEGRGSAGRALRQCLSEKAKEFFQGANKEGVTVLKQMIEMEAWQRVPVPLQETGGVGGLIDNNAMRFCSPHRVYRGIRQPYLHLMHDVMSLDPSDHRLNDHDLYQRRREDSAQVAETQELTETNGDFLLEDKKNAHSPLLSSSDSQQPLLRGWHRRGNPFRMFGEANSASVGDNDETLTPGEGMSGVGLGRLPAGADVDDDPDRFIVAAGGAAAGGVSGSRDRGGAATGVRGSADLHEELEAEEKRYGSGWVVTQAALNGVARYAGHALQIMALVRPAAPSAFEGLRQLVDLYIYCAFTLFCPQWAIDTLYGFGEEELVPPPEEQESLAILKSFMSRVSQDLNSPEPGSRSASPQNSPERPAGVKGRHSTGGGTSDSGKRRQRTRSTTPGAARPTGGPDETNWNDPLGLAFPGSPPTTTSSPPKPPRDRGARASLDSVPASEGGVGGGGGRGVGNGGRDSGDPMGDLWSFAGGGTGGDSPARSRTSSTTANQGLFGRRSEPSRHPTPRAPIPLPACMAAAALKGADGPGIEGLLSAGDALWGVGGAAAGGSGAGGGGVEKTAEWMSLGERAVAIESCLFVIQVLKAARRRTIGLGLLPLSQRAAVDAYVNEAEVAAAQLRTFAYRAQGPGLAGHADIATAAEGQSWTLKQLRNDASPYVEQAIKRCRLVRAAIDITLQPSPVVGAEAARPSTVRPGSPSLEAETQQNGAGAGSGQAGVDVVTEAVLGAKVVGVKRVLSPTPAGVAVKSDDRATLVPARARGLAWRGVVDACLLALLRGFSRVKRCSTEGRALMSMDLQALALGLEDPMAAQTVKAHVHAYVNAFYFGEEDLLKWIKEHWRSYPMHQMVSLLQCGDGSTASGMLRKHRVKDLVVQVEALYQPDKVAPTTPSSNNNNDAKTSAQKTSPPTRGQTTHARSPNMPNTSSSAGLPRRGGVSSVLTRASGGGEVNTTGIRLPAEFNGAENESTAGSDEGGGDEDEQAKPSQLPSIDAPGASVEGRSGVPSPLPTPLRTPGGGMKGGIGSGGKMGFLKSGGGLSPPRISMMTNQFRRAVDKINGAMTSAENAIVKKASSLTEPSSNSFSPGGDYVVPSDKASGEGDGIGSSVDFGGNEGVEGELAPVSEEGSPET